MPPSGECGLRSAMIYTLPVISLYIIENPFDNVLAVTEIE